VFKTANHKLLNENYDLKKALKAAKELVKPTSGLQHKTEVYFIRKRNILKEKKYLYLFTFVLKENGDQEYDCGVIVTAVQQAELHAFSRASVDDGRYIAALLQISYGTPVLAVSSISGKAKNIVTTTKLCEKKLEFVKRKFYRIIFLTIMNPIFSFF
jgi:hypothetical protein